MRLRGVLLACVMVVLAGTVSAFDRHLVFSDSITPADSLAVRHDTAYSDIFNLFGRMFQCGTRIAENGGDDDTEWVEDTFFINLQSSFDRNGTVWITHAVDTHTTNGYQTSTMNLDRDATVIGNFGRIMMIHRDSIDAGEADSAAVNRARPFKKKITMYLYGF